ncbi:hypothetical protein F7018_17095 [Tenacibaculum aiptasiae]|uniref:SRPBCC family protein n=1 Tax=Tenacibaculum aiptasiae TaxID=426481 RepID=A0A7J5A740_9FLAO|nr:hypothetical protein [Tenacibaculum aiptasiae]KAB1153381.1 hypothetical protein F7018_17095 [Tenacibaculum aiptasiae]
MKVVNIHHRTYNASLDNITDLFYTLSSTNDKVWPTEKWPRMTFKGGIKLGASGGHGPIRYKVEKYSPEKLIQFRFAKPLGFIGTHRFEIKEVQNNQTQVMHTIEMNTKGIGTLIWLLAIRSLHNALLKDCLDKIENNFTQTKVHTQWNWYVKFIRTTFKLINKK